MFQMNSNTSTALRVQNRGGVSIFGAEIRPSVSPKPASLLRYFHMYRTFANSKLFCGPADGGFVFHDKFSQPGGSFVDYAASHRNTPRF